MKTRQPTILYVLTVFAIVLVFWMGYLVFLPMIYPKVEHQGLFGDSFGGLNTLFSGFAFAGVIISLILQRNELELQRKELELTRKELTDSSKSQRDMSKSNKEQLSVLIKTAQLNGLTTMLNYWQSMNPRNTGEEEKKEASIEVLYEKLNSIYIEIDKEINSQR